MTLSLLGSANLVRPRRCLTDLRTARLAIAKGDRSDRVMHSSQVAGHDDPPYAGMETRRAVLLCGKGASRRDPGWGG